MTNNAGHWVVVTKDKAGEYRWVRYAANGEEVSGSTEGYHDKSHAVEQAYQLNPDVSDVRIPE